MRLLRKYDIEDFLFFDIETAPSTPELIKDTPLWDAWEHHCIKYNIEDIQGSYLKDSPLQAEFGRIICISVGVVRNNKIHLKTFNNKDEKTLLENFNTTVSKLANNKTWLCGHVITGFDIPFVMKRCLVNRVLPHILFDTGGLKPWELSVMDTATLWKGTSFKISTLLSVCSALGVESPKDDIDGGDVGRIFWEGDIDRISTYCEKDVIAVINVVMALRGEDPLEVKKTKEPVKEKVVGVLDYLFAGGEYTEEVSEGLIKVMSKMSKADKARAIEILKVLPCKAKGKQTKILHSDIKELIKNI